MTKSVANISEKDRPLRVLSIDIEGGHGGSSRSLLQMLRAVDRNQVTPEVWCRHGGAIEEAYGALGIPVTVAADMPRLTALERNTRNLVDVARFFAQRWPQSQKFRAQLSARLRDVELLHLNHVSLFWLARWVRKEHPSLPITMHIRTQPVNTILARWQSRVAKAVCSSFVFITENERDHFVRLSGGGAEGQVIYNPVEVASGIDGTGTALDAAIGDHCFTAVCLSNYAHCRGLDRLIEVAKHLDQMKDREIHFIMAGDMHLTGALSGALAEVAQCGGTLADYAEKQGVSRRFTFLGHVSDPEALLSRADVLLKPTREDNPWGRDILEALGHGVPVASVGSYERFVKTGHTGLLQKTFNAAELATWMVGLTHDRERLIALGRGASRQIAELCNPMQQAAQLVQFWRDTIRSADVMKKSVP